MKISVVGPAAGATLNWDAVEGCPSEADVRFAIERRLERPLSRARPARIQAVVSRADGGYVGRIRMSTDGDGAQPPDAPRAPERVFSVDDCWKFADIVAAMAALSIGERERPEPIATGAASPSAAQSDSSMLPAGTPAIVHAAVAAVTNPAPDAADAPAGSRVRLGLSASLAVDGGSLPERALGPEVAVAGHFGDLALHATVAWLARQTVSAPPPDSALEGQIKAVLFGALGCWQSAASHVEHELALGMSGCLGWEVARWTGRGSRSSDSAWWTGPRLEAGVHATLVRLPHVRFGVRLAGILPLSQPALQLTRASGSANGAPESAIADELDPVIIRGLVGAEVVLP